MTIAQKNRHACLGKTQGKMWERACSRMRSVSQRKYRLTHRFREQARSHSRSVLPIRVVHGAGAHR
ncbi:hypothetical protein B0A76_27795 [Pseudomonas fluorescens]|nr:hypothetical protein B0A76_27795 [Pseudomonas fluorescens]